jgi:hypothetical protein
MKPYLPLKTFSIFSYCFIILKGWFIGVPFIFYLFMTLFDFGTYEQLAGVAAFLGLYLTVIPFLKNRTKHSFLLESASFLLLLVPLVQRLISVPIKLFDYGAFKYPLFTFILSYFLAVLFSFKEKRKVQEKSLEHIQGPF